MSFSSEQISKVLEENKGSEYPLSITVRGENSSTKNLNITKFQALRIKELLKNTNKIDIDDRVSLANNSSIVCGTVKHMRNIVPDIYVVWDDNLYPGSDDNYSGWFHQSELDKINRDITKAISKD